MRRTSFGSRSSRRLPARQRVYGATSSQDKALDNGKSVKSKPSACGVDISRATFTAAFPPGCVHDLAALQGENLSDEVFH